MVASRAPTASSRVCAPRRAGPAWPGSRRRRRRGRGSVGSGRASSRPRAAFLALSTSGWSNGLMPSRRPAIATAYSQSRNCAPRGPPTVTASLLTARGSVGPSSSATPCRALTRRTTRTSSAPAVTSGAPGPSATTGRRPLPSLPVDSAMSCSAQSREPGDPRALVRRTRSCRAAGRCRRGRPRGSARGCPRRPRSAGRRTSAAWSSRPPMSAPASPLGTRPNAVSAE